MLDENRYCITLAAAGFDQSDLTITVERGVLSVRGNWKETAERNYLHQGISNRDFERKFNLAEHVEVTEADMENGLLAINLVRKVPETLKPKTIEIQSLKALESEAHIGQVGKAKKAD